MKISDAADSTVMAYNLAKDFGIKIPCARYLELDNKLDPDTVRGYWNGLLGNG